jgi:hypothetical protein
MACVALQITDATSPAAAEHVTRIDLGKRRQLYLWMWHPSDDHMIELTALVIGASRISRSADDRERGRYHDKGA